MQLSDALPFAYGDSTLHGTATGADWKTEKVVQTCDKDGEDMERENDAGMQERGGYSISFQIREEWVLMSNALLAHLFLLFCLQSSLSLVCAHDR